MGDVIQPMVMTHFLSSVAPNQCFWYAHPAGEDSSHGHSVGQFFGGDSSRLISLTQDDAEEVRG